MIQPAGFASRNKQIWRFCKSQIAELGVNTEEGLIALCLDDCETDDRRGRACHVLGFLDPPGTVQALITLAEGPNIYVAVSAINSLSVIKNRKATGPLMKLIRESTNEEVENTAIRCLGQLGDKKAESLICDLLLGAKSEYTRSAAAQALSILAHQEQSFEALIAALHDEAAVVRWTASVTLGHIGDDRAVEPLRSRLADKELLPGLPSEETISRAAEYALQQIAVRAARRKSRS